MELYHLERDLDESEDLSTSRPELTAELRARLFDWLDAVDAQRPEHNPEYDSEKDPAGR